MKHLTKFIVLAVLITTHAQAQKIAHVHLDSLVSLMPEYKTAQQQAQDYYKQLEAQLMTMQNELQTKYQEYTQNEPTYTALIKQTKQEELQRLQQNIQEFQVKAQQDYQAKQVTLTKPISEKANKAIEQVAKESGYRYVLDSSAGMLLYSEPSDDIFGLVKKKLGITATATATPAADPKKQETKKEEPKK